ncbi:MAG: EAL domain-containing protein [Pseudomonadota bacterium]
MSTIDRTLLRLRNHLGMDIAYISEVGDEIIHVRALCAPEIPDLSHVQSTLKRETGFCHYVVNDEIPRILHDVSEFPVVAKLAMRADFNIESFIGMPLSRQDGSIYGTLGCISHHKNTTLNDRDLETVKLFAEMTAEQIDHELEDRRKNDERATRLQAVWDQNLLHTKLQPIVRLSDMSYKGFEALARFQTEPYRSPDQWFQEATHAGRGIELELEAIRSALPHLKHLPQAYSLGLNASPACLQSEAFHDLLFKHDPTQLILELTEQEEVEDYGALLACVQKFKDMGFRIAIDDAGAGYAGLNHIVQIQPHIIKLDMSLTRDVHEDKVRRSLANALVYFAKETDAEIVAEGVETVEEMNALKQLGVDYGQGYYFDKPLDIGEAVDRIKTGKAA